MGGASPSTGHHAIRAHLRGGMHLQALRAVGDPTSLDVFTTAEEAHQAYRMLGRLGAVERAERIALRAFTRARRDPWAEHLFLSVVLERRGPFAAWEAARRLARRRGDTDIDGHLAFLSDDTPEALLPFRLFLAGHVLIALRDFDTANEAAEALTETIEPTWAHDLAARVHHACDRREEALASARRALGGPGDLSPLHLVIDVLRELGRDDEAYALLAEREAEIECGGTSLRLAAMARARGAFSDAEAALGRADSRLPLRGASVTDNLDGFRVGLAYEAGDLSRARTLAAAMASPSARRFAEAIDALDEKARSAPHVRLRVPFVAQHHMTCVPATLSALLLHQGVVIDQSEVADSICYDGTKTHAERAWATSRGFLMREFTVDFDVAVALVDRGVAFSLVLVSSIGAHMVAVVGYDMRLGLLLVNDPGRPDLVRLDGRNLDRSYGPRGAVVLTAERAALLEGIALPDSDLHDALHAVHDALERDDVSEAREKLSLMPPGARLARWAERAIALHVDDYEKAGAVSAALLAEDATDHQSRRLLAAALSRSLEGAELVDRLRALTEHASAEVAPVHALLASALLRDARTTGDARAAARRCLRSAPALPDAIHVLARASWAAGEVDEGFEMARVAAKLAPFQEECSLVALRIGFAAGRRREAFALLRSRADAALVRSGAPSITLAEALLACNRATEALAVVARALEARPSDRELAEAAAAIFARLERRTRLRALVRAAPRDKKASRLRALVAEVEGDEEAALELWRRELAAAPGNTFAADRVASLLAERVPRSEVVAFIREAIRASPVPRVMARALTPRLAEGEALPAEIGREDGVRLRRDASDALRAAKLDDALALAKRAMAVESRSPENLALRARIARARRKPEIVAKALRRALELAPDRPDLIHELVRLAPNNAEAASTVTWIAALLAERTVSGAGVDALAEAAHGVVDAGHLLAELAAVHLKRPSCWIAAMVVAELQFEAGRREEALERARRVAQGWPLDVDAVARAAGLEMRGGDADRAWALARQVYRESPTPGAALLLARAAYARGRGARGKAIVLAAAKRFPRASPLVQAAVRLLDRPSEARAEAIGGLLELRSTDLGLWQALAAALPKDAEPSLVDRAVALSEARPADGRMHQVVSLLARGQERWPLAIEHARRARDLLPLEAGAVETLAIALAGAGRRSEAIELSRTADLMGLDGLHARARGLHLELTAPNANERERESARTLLKRMLKTHAGAHLARAALMDDAAPRGAHEVGLRLAKGKLALLPSDESALRHVAAHHLDHSTPDVALPLLERLHVVSPEDEAVTRALLDARLALGHRLGLAPLASKLAEPSVRALYAVRLALADPGVDRALDALGGFATVEALVRDAFLRAVALVRDKAKDLGRLTERMDALASSPGSSSSFVAAWAGCRDQLDPSATHQFVSSLPEGPRGHALAGLVHQRNGLRSWWNLRAIHRATPAWGELLFQWTEKQLFVRVALLGRGAARRADAKPWMLQNLAIAYRALGLNGAAERTHRFALTLPDDHSTPRHRWSLALHCMFRGDYEEAAALATSSGTETDDEPLREIRRWARLLLEVHERSDRVADLRLDLRSITERRGHLGARREWYLDHRAFAAEAEFERRRLAGDWPYRFRVYRWLNAQSGTRTLAFVLVLLVGAASAVVYGAWTGARAPRNQPTHDTLPTRR